MEDEQRKRCFIRGYAIGEIIGSLKTNTREFAEDMIEHKLAGGTLIKSLRFFFSGITECGISSDKVENAMRVIDEIEEAWKEENVDRLTSSLKQLRNIVEDIIG